MTLSISETPVYDENVTFFLFKIKIYFNNIKKIFYK